MKKALPHVRRLAVEATFIMREVVADLERPVMLYSIDIENKRADPVETTKCEDF